MKGEALVLTAGLLAESKAKTAHGLLRGSSRFPLVGVIDEVHAGKDASDVVSDVPAGVPVYATLSEALNQSQSKPKFLIVGIATKGGVLPSDLRNVVHEALLAGLSIVNGLHETLSDDHRFAAAAAEAGVAIHDIRKPKPFRELRFWSGEICDVACPIIAVLGLDCAAGKRTTAKILAEGMRARGREAEMVYTGQTGWMLGFQYGFIFDATPNDFVCGELEHAIVSCWKERNPDVIFLEGQSGLRNPSGPCGAEYLLSAQAKAVVLQHVCGREYYVGTEHLGFTIPSVADEIDLLRHYGAEALAITLNTSAVSTEEAEQTQRELVEELGIPVVNPLETAEPVLEAVTRYCDAYVQKAT